MKNSFIEPSHTIEHRPGKLRPWKLARNQILCFLGGEVDGINPNLSEAIAQSGRKLSFSKVTTWVHGGKKAKAWQRTNHFKISARKGFLSKQQGMFGLQYGVQPFQHRIFSQGDLIHKKATPTAHRFHQSSICPLENSVIVRTKATQLGGHGQQTALGFGCIQARSLCGRDFRIRLGAESILGQR